MIHSLTLQYTNMTAGRFTSHPLPPRKTNEWQWKHNQHVNVSPIKNGDVSSIVLLVFKVVSWWIFYIYVLVWPEFYLVFFLRRLKLFIRDLLLQLIEPISVQRLIQPPFQLISGFSTPKFMAFVDVGVSKNRVVSPMGVFHYKPSILGYHYFWKHPCVFFPFFQAGIFRFHVV